MIHDYPTFEALNIALDYLWLGTHEEIQARGAASTPQQAAQATPDPLPEDGTPARKHVRHERTYKSIYVGVTTHNRRYTAPGSGGTVHPLTPEGERRAAVDRALSLERDWLERRDGTQEPL